MNILDHFRRLTWMVAVVFVFGSMPVVASPVILAREGRAECTIVAGRDDGVSQVYIYDYQPVTRAVPSRVLAESARDLADHLNEMGMIWKPEDRINVVAEVAEARTHYRILLGSAAIEEYGLHAEAQTIPYHGYVIRTVGNDLLIFGSSSKGAANGVYGFLQDELGVRWFGSHALFQHVPQHETVQVTGLDQRIVPSFPGLNVKAEYYADHPAYPWMRRRMRMSETLDVAAPFSGTSGHNMRTRALFGGDRYFESHPEYYAMRSGRRMEPSRGRTVICYANPEVIEIATEAALAHFRRSERHHAFSLGIDDGSAYCECEACAKLQPTRTFRGGRVASDMYFHFVNAVARRVRQEFPDRILGVDAYADVTLPPLGDVEDNVHVVVVQDLSEFFDPAFRAVEHEVSAGWVEKGLTLGLYYYTDLAKLVPAHFARMLARELKERHAQGYLHVTPECRPNVFNGPMYYVQSRLLWDIDLDVDALLDEYFTTLYGPAAPHMAALFDLFEVIHMRPRPGRMFGEHYDFSQFRPYTREDLERIRALIADAHAAIEGLGTRRAGPEERRLAYTTSGMRLFLDMLEGYVLAQEIEQMPEAPDAVDAMVVLQRIERVNDILGRHERVYREAIIQDEFLGPRSRGDTATSVRNAWKNRLSNAIGEALAVLHGMQAESDSRRDGRLQREISRHTANESTSGLFLYRTGQWIAEENRVVNPGFEIMGADFGDFRHLDWEPSPAYGWFGWQIIPGQGSFGVSSQTTLSGTQSGVMNGIGRGGFATVIRDIHAEERYHVRAHIHNPMHTVREDKPNVTLEIFWLDENDRWARPRRNAYGGVETRELDRWIELEQVVQVPAGAVSAALWVFANSLHDDEAIFVDNVSFRRLREP